MFEYRLYCFEKGAKFSSLGQTILARDDHEALALARSKKLNTPCELWNQNRFVAAVAAS